MRKGIMYLFFGLLALSACRQNRQQEAQPDTTDIREQLIQYNIRKVQEEDSLIAAFAEKSNIDYTRSSTGMRYKVYPEGKGDSIRTEDVIRVAYTLRLLDSTLCYAVGPEEALEFKVEKSDVASGFHELVQKMCVADSATAIWPARLGYGLAGDQNKIPQEAVLLVDLKVLQK